MQSYFIIVVSLLFQFSLSAQSREAEDYQVAEAALKDLITKISFSYYYPDEPLDPRKDPNPLHPDSLYVMFDPKTYEETTYRGKTLIAERNAEYQKESKLYRLRTNSSKKMILVGTFLEANLHKKGALFKDIPLDISLENLRAYDWKTDKLALNTDFIFKKWNKENFRRYKYLIAAYVWMSKVLYNQQHDKALMEFGFHYNYTLQNGGAGGGAGGGGGGFILFSKIDGQWKVEKWFGIWEE